MRHLTKLAKKEFLYKKLGFQRYKCITLYEIPPRLEERMKYYL